MSLILSTSWYILKSKYDENTYKLWLDNMLSNVVRYELVVYTDNVSVFDVYRENPRILIVYFPLKEFYTYRYKEKWIENHAVNTELNTKVSWKVNMLWSEKVFFVEKTRRLKNSPDAWYGWCDIGYFRCNSVSLHRDQLEDWPNPERLANLDPTKIHYGLVNTYDMNDLIRIVQNKNDKGLPVSPIPPNQVSISGGFFLLKESNLSWWKETYDTKLRLYFENNYLVKDDQMIVLDCIISNWNRFLLHTENHLKYDNWFMFQRILN